MESLLSNTRKPDLSFFKDGHIDITARVAKSIGLEDGDVIDILKDGKELYLYVKIKSKDVIGMHAGRCRSTHPDKAHRNFRTNCKRLCNAIFDICNNDCLVKIAAGEAFEIPNIGLVVPLITRINLHQYDKRD
jgi:hypothetical protein